MQEIQKEKLGLWTAALIYVGLQLFLLRNEFVLNDEMVYAWNVKLLQDSVSNIASPILWQYHPPLFSLLAFIPSFFLDPLTSIRLVSLLFGCAAIYFTYLLGKELFSKRVGTIAALLMVGNVYFLAYSHHGIIDAAFTAACALALLGLLRLQRTQNMDWLIMGAAIALLLKRSGFLVFGLAFIGFWAYKINAWRGKPHSFSAKEAGLAVVVSLLLGVGVWALQQSFDREILTFYDYSAGLLSIAVSNIPILWDLFSFGVIFFVLGLLVWRKQHEWEWMLFLGVLVFALVLFFPYAEVRYFIPLLPLIGVLMAAGIDSVRLRFTPLQGVIQVAIVGILVVPGILAFTWIQLHPTTGIGYASAGEWLRGHAGSAVVYDSLEREIRYYSHIELQEHGGKLTKYPLDSIDFENQIMMGTDPIFAVVANWPNNFGPFYPTDEYMHSLGFVEVENVRRIINDKNISVIRVYRKN